MKDCCYGGWVEQHRRKEMGNPFVHVELNTTDIGKAKTFYGQLFDWELEDVEMGPSGRYTLIKRERGRVAGC